MPPVSTLPSWESQPGNGHLTLPTAQRPTPAHRPERPIRTREHAMPVATELRGVVAEHIAAVNAFDLNRIVATFTPDAYVNDVSREIWGLDAIRAFLAKEFVGDHVTMEVREVL